MIAHSLASPARSRARRSYTRALDRVEPRPVPPHPRQGTQRSFPMTISLADVTLLSGPKSTLNSVGPNVAPGTSYIHVGPDWLRYWITRAGGPRERCTSA